MRNTLLVDTDLLYARPSETDSPHSLDDDLVEIGFEDMEPIQGFDLVGIEPHTAIAILPFVEFDVVGVAPYTAITMTPINEIDRHTALLDPDGVPTEEFSSWDASNPGEASF